MSSWQKTHLFVLLECVYLSRCRAYTFGKSFFVEVDIVLAPDMPLHQAHDIGEALQNKLEALPEVERAFCHLVSWSSCLGDAQE